MPQLIKDIHVSCLSYVTEAKSNESKYKRFSIPYKENRHCLGYLEGPSASIVDRTRNDHFYNLQLWRKVEESEDFQEGMRCATIIGEADHPEERVDYSLTKGAVVLTDWEIREDEGILWCRFAILDNDEGKTILSYLRFGTELGVSSRGLGDEISDPITGKNIIDPDTYEFYCFDVVAFPAAAIARQKFVPEPVTEARSIQTAFEERALRELDECSDISSLQNLQVIVESTNIKNKKHIIDSISEKVSRLSESADKQRTEDDNKDILLSSDSASDKELDYKSLLDRSRKNCSYFKKLVQDQQKEIESLEDAVDEGLKSIDDLADILEKTQNSLNDAEKKNEDYDSKIFDYESKLSATRAENYTLQRREKYNESMRSRYSAEKDNCNKLSQLLEKKSARITELENYLESISSQLDSLRRDYSSSQQDVLSKEEENSSLKESLSSQKKEFEESLQLRDSQIQNLHESIVELTNSRNSSQTKLEKSQQTIKSLQESLKGYQSSSAKILDSYVTKLCKIDNLEESRIRGLLPKNFKLEDVEKVIEEANRIRSNMDDLPIKLNEGSRVSIVDHSASSDSSTPTFLIEALRRGI